jgi:transposase-like protein
MVIVENKKRQYADKNTILRHLSLLESNGMNITLTAKEAGVDRSSIYRWKKQYWQEYLDNKKKINEQVYDIEAIKFSTVKEFDVLRNICTEAFRLALNRVIEILSDSGKLKTLSNKDLNEFIKNIGPYCAEKVGLSGTETPLSPFQDHTTFIQNIIEQLNVKGIKNMRNDNKQDQV